MASFLQSLEWQEVQERMGRPTRRIRDVLLIRHDIPFGFHYLYAPRPDALSAEFLSDALGQTKRDRAIFLKIDPLSMSPASSSLIQDSRFTVREGHALQPGRTLLIDCRQTDAPLLAAMHPKTRYNIRLAERRGVSVRYVSRQGEAADFESFYRLLAMTAGREGFSLHPREQYRVLMETASADFSNELFVAEYEGQPIAAALANFYAPAKTATYLHGGSARERQDLMAPHLLHWRIIQRARERGFATYDFGGIDEVRWPGLTRFKSGFGGERVFFPSSRDFVARPWLYSLYVLQRRFRRG